MKSLYTFIIVKVGETLKDLLQSGLAH